MSELEKQSIPKETLYNRLLEVEGMQCEAVGRINWNNLHKLNPVGEYVTVGIELCPLYTVGTTLAESTLDSTAASEVDIVSSRVGRKWIATKAVLQELQGKINQGGQKMRVQATFADIGVFASSKSEANKTTVDSHAKVYEDALQGFCDTNDITLEFRRLRDVQPIVRAKAVSDFIVAENGEMIYDPSLEMILAKLWFTEKVPLQSNRLRKRAEVVMRLLNMCGNNFTVLQGLVHTYLNYNTTQDCDIHIGMERADSLLALQTLTIDSHFANQAALNVLVT